MKSQRQKKIMSVYKDATWNGHAQTSGKSLNRNRLDYKPMTVFPILASGKVDIVPDSKCSAIFLTIDIPSSKALVYQAIWQQHIRHFSEIKTISKQDHRKLENILNCISSNHTVSSSDGTQKFLWKIPQGGVIETVLIPDADRPNGYADRLTLCVSSQWGCAMKCSFCLTGDLGLKGHLWASQIAGQIQQISETLHENQRITNIVMMGMGEPLHNYDQLVVALRTMNHNCALRLSNRKITVSSVGLLPALRRLTEEIPVNIAISLNATTEEQRRQVMPITKRYSLQELLDTCMSITQLPNSADVESLLNMS